MAKFLTIGYGDEAGYRRTQAAPREAAHAHDAGLRQEGVEMGVAGSPVQVRNHDASGTTTQEGHQDISFMPGSTRSRRGARQGSMPPRGATTRPNDHPDIDAYAGVLSSICVQR